MYNNCAPCRCCRMYAVIQKIAEKVCETKIGELTETLPILIEEIVTQTIDETTRRIINEMMPSIIEESVEPLVESIVNRILEERLSGLGFIGIQAQLYGTPGIEREILNNGIVPFSLTIYNNSDITLSDGQFTITTPGTYLVDWGVVAANGELDPITAFGLSVNGITRTQSSRMNLETPINTATLVQLEAEDIITLRNISGQTVRLAVPGVTRQGAINFQANIVMTRIGSATLASTILQ